jgi:hypothetical protein
MIERHLKIQGPNKVGTGQIELGYICPEIGNVGLSYLLTVVGMY